MSKRRSDGANITKGHPARRGMVVTILCAAVVLAAVILTLTGTRYYIRSDKTWGVSGYTGFSHTISVPDTRFGIPVTEVSYQAFFLSDITGVKLGDNVKKLDSYAFFGCERLETVQLNYGLETIGSLCFSDCKGLREVTIPSTVNSIDHNAFSGCPELTILAPRGSYAAKFAVENGIPWQNIDESTVYAVS